MDTIEKAQRVRELLNTLDECTAELETIVGGGA